MLLGGGLVTVICVSGPAIGAAGLLEQPGVASFFLAMVVCNGLAASVLLCILGLQLARVKLRVYEDPLDPAPEQPSRCPLICSPRCWWGCQR